MVGLLFLVIGVLWGSAIYFRIATVLPDESFFPSSFITTQASLSPCSSPAQIPFPHSDLMSFLGVLEVFCFLFYIWAGLSFLRGYRSRLLTARIALYLDIIFKAGIINFLFLISCLYQFPLGAKNIFARFYVFNLDFWGFASGFFSGGIFLTTVGGIYLMTCIAYFVFWFQVLNRMRERI